MNVFNTQNEYTDVTFLQEAKNIHIKISYTFLLGNDERIHTYEFFTDDLSDEGIETWAAFLDLITNPDENNESLIYYVKRDGSAMREFSDLCLVEKYPANAA